jgi:hypothetical protein
MVLVRWRACPRGAEASETRGGPAAATAGRAAVVAPRATADQWRRRGPGATGCRRRPRARSNGRACSGERTRGVVQPSGPAQGLLDKPQGVLQVDPADVDPPVGPPQQLQIETAGAVPPQPQHLGWAGAGRPTSDLEATWTRTSVPRTIGRAAWSRGSRGVAARGGPDGRVVGVELGAVAAGPADPAGRGRWRIGVEATARRGRTRSAARVPSRPGPSWAGPSWAGS